MLTALVACAPVDLLNAVIPTGGLTITRDIAYGEEAKQRLDLYVPKTLKPYAPVIVFFYGGAWQEGDKKNYLFAAQALASIGAVVVVPNYRVYPEVTFPGFLEDAAAATAWTLKNIAHYGGDPKSIFVAGHSAGAYLSIMLVLDQDYLTRAGVAGAKLAGGIGISGPYDFLPLTRSDVKPIFEVVPDMAVTQPITYARGDAPPLLLVTGDADTTVGPYNSHNLANKLRALGGRVEDRYYPGVQHIGSVLALTSLFRGRAPVLADIVGFVSKTRAEAE
ncbi:MAG: alpha/beta hydrolase [Rhodospirillales bacterium]|nr:alpha/beta hydrolase [Rhodospirillales bacterium]